MHASSWCLWWFYWYFHFFESTLSHLEILDAVDLEILDAVRAPRIIPSDSSFKKLVEKFTSKVKFLKKLLRYIATIFCIIAK